MIGRDDETRGQAEHALLTFLNRELHANQGDDMTFLINVLVSALLISVASWVSGRSPALAGFLVALPLATMLVLPMSYLEHGSTEASILLAKSIFIAIPVSLLFFLPFLATSWLGISFWQAYGLGCGALVAGYFTHRAITGLFIHAG